MPTIKILLITLAIFLLTFLLTEAFRAYELKQAKENTPLEEQLQEKPLEQSDWMQFMGKQDRPSTRNNPV